MPNYSKLHDLISHRVTIEYDTGARVTGYLASCQPSSGPVVFCVLSEAKLIDSRGRVVRELQELTICPNILTSIALDEGPRGRDVHKDAREAQHE
jgi:small nuclear ribonucleoprotein (snRNP)-like protein